MNAERQGWARFTPSLPLIVGLSVLLLTLACSPGLLYDPDTYLHIGVGRWILAHRALPMQDPFSNSMPGAHWSVPQWLAEVILASCYDTLGWRGLVALTAICYAGAIAFLARYLLARADPLTTLILAAAAAAMTVRHALARAHILAMPLMVFWCGEIFAARDRGRRPSLWLVPVMALWANLHGSFLFGLGTAGFLALEATIWPGSDGRLREIRGWSLFVALAIAAASLTPSGPAGLLEPLRLMRMDVLLSTFDEWLSPNFQVLQPLEFWLLGIVFVSLWAGLNLPLPRLIFLLGLLHMGLQHARHGDLVGLIAPLAIAGSLGPQIAAKVRSDPPSGLARSLARLAQPATWPACALWLALMIALGVPRLMEPIVRVDDPSTPSGALAAARRMNLSGPVLNTELFGGYLIFSGVKPFIDGRIEMYGNAFLKDFLDAAIFGHQPALSNLLEKYHIAWTLLDPSNASVEKLDQMPGWRRAYADDHAVIFVRESAP